MLRELARDISTRWRPPTPAASAYFLPQLNQRRLGMLILRRAMAQLQCGGAARRRRHSGALILLGTCPGSQLILGTELRDYGFAAQKKLLLDGLFACLLKPC